MKRRLRYALLLVGLYAVSLVPIAVTGALFWSDLDWVERDSLRAILEREAPLFVLSAVVMFAVVAVLLREFRQRYVTPQLRMAEGTRIILGANPAHRVIPEGGAEPQALAEVINAFAARHEALQRDVDARIHEAQARADQERNRLAALVSELNRCVLVCNADGRILLFNPRAKELLGRRAGGEAAIGGASLVGLGRSVFAIFDRSLVAHALETVQARLERGVAPAAATFAASAGDHLVHVQVTAVSEAPGGAADPAGERPRPLAGFVLLADDVTEQVEREGRKAAAFHGLADASRRALASIRAAVETLLAYPEMDAARQARFVGVISEEAARLTGKLERSETDFAATQRAEGLQESVPGTDLTAAIGRRIEGRVGIPVLLEEVDPSVWLRADAWALMQALTALATWIHAETAVPSVALRLRAAGRLAQLDLAWPGAPLDPALLPAWEDRPLAAAGEPSPLTLRQVVERHDGELWHQLDGASGGGHVRLVLPLAQPAKAKATARAAPAEPSRPEFFDFDLFHQAGQTPELDQRRLSDLAFTVFDTETTGLFPLQDAIVCVGAVRILNGRLLHHDTFEQFVDPHRAMPETAARITGIGDEMLRGQPSIEQVLPQFHAYCEDTVLVAHNAAFDMRFLQLQEERSGARFTQPVLDTLLLSAVLHPNLAAHRVEDLAERYGIPIIGRHTALGDAIMTGEILLKMIPQLAQMGIHTLGEAREASQRTWLSRLQY